MGQGTWHCWELENLTGSEMSPTHITSATSSTVARRGSVGADRLRLITLGNTPNTDILVSDSEGTQFVHVLVLFGIPDKRSSWEHTLSVSISQRAVFTLPRRGEAQGTWQTRSPSGNSARLNKAQSSLRATLLPSC